MSFDTLLFVCAICEREVRDYPDRNGRDRHIAPICRGCESRWPDRPPQAGAFMDRRKAAHLSALANCLNNTAHIRQWEARHGRA
ncbi:hypothetical protein MEX01_48740 [Methylorubrum extorquens]|uniref:hypothetical protein n=1 Tax=Methylorubrum extorquens TaxID=408 RepID=UPI0011714D81|nr:hypothetical protein [Methylorubrum extorquens]GEL44283.1 hypothetical protein MEX01_48740 [Methylorubrum extorquens]